MRISSGCTRVVLVVGNKAYKIAKFRPIALVLKLIRTACSKEEFDRLYEIHQHNKVGAALGMLFSGLRANWREWKYWNRTKDTRCVPSLSIWFGGMVLVQEAAEPVADTEVLSSFCLAALWYADREFSNSTQFGRCGDGSIRIVDYATLS